MDTAQNKTVQLLMPLDITEKIYSNIFNINTYSIYLTTALTLTLPLSWKLLISLRRYSGSASFMQFPRQALYGHGNAG